MRKWTWIAVLGVALLSLGTAWAESKACDPTCWPPCDDASCCVK